MKLNIFFIAIIVGLAAYMVFGHNGLIKYRELVRIKNNYQLQLETTEEKVENLETELNQVSKNVEYLEMMIKKELSLQKPEEDLYIMEEPLFEEDKPKEEESEKSE
ncbi:MAG: cell division protein FtsB [Denitrovibrio sp.]|nr:MAG: cell division protein FtsB [Denitrovibrio sp.]